LKGIKIINRGTGILLALGLSFSIISVLTDSLDKNTSATGEQKLQTTPLLLPAMSPELLQILSPTQTQTL